MSETVEHISFEVTYSDIMKYQGAVETSVLDFTKRAYKAENQMIMEVLAKNGLSLADVTNYGYVSGMFKPFGFSGMPATATPYYEVILKVRRSQGRQRPQPGYDPSNGSRSQTASGTEELKKQALARFMEANIHTDRQQRLKIVYRELALKYHPDRGGDTELMKYINSLKKMYIK